MAHVIREQHRRDGTESDDAISVETRTFGLRDGDQESVWQITLDRRRLKLRWGVSGQTMRTQQIQFSTVAEARIDYRKRLNGLKEKGYLDATGE